MYVFTPSNLAKIRKKNPKKGRKREETRRENVLFVFAEDFPGN